MVAGEDIHQVLLPSSRSTFMWFTVGEQAAAQTQTLEYGNTASLQAVIDSCSTLTNARLVHLMLGPYRLKSHLRMLKKFLLHGQVRLYYRD